MLGKEVSRDDAFSVDLPLPVGSISWPDLQALEKESSMKRFILSLPLIATLLVALVMTGCESSCC